MGSGKKIEKTFSVQPGGKLFVDADEGNITITGSETSEIAVHVYARGSDELLRKFDVKFDQDGNTVTVGGRLKHKYFDLFGNNDLDIEFEIQIPSKFNLDLRTSGGNISVDNLTGDIVGETSGGNLILGKLDGAVKMSTSGGNISLRGASGNFQLETSGGNIHGEGIVGDTHVETSGGNIELRDLDGKLYGSTSGGDIRAEMKNNKGIDLSTSGGNLIVRLPKSATGDVTAEATGGDVSCDFQFAGKMKDGSMNGKINGGGNLIRLETSGGDIVINSLE
jgi:DUF4097 and DUF4098 domain-containing protein YvlB